MADPSSSTQEPRISLDRSSSSEVDRRKSDTSRRRHDHYGGQRGSRSSRPNLPENQATASPKDKRSDYDEPAEFSNLDEVAAPPPVKDSIHASDLEALLTIPQQPGDSRLDEHARKRKSAQQGGQEVSELAALPPMQKSRGGEGVGQQSYPEDDGNVDDVSNITPGPFQPRQPRDYLHSMEGSGVPRHMTELYTISYLIFFSIIGTLARLGVQWITFYPGTPVVTPVIWANFAGSLLMGFLAEDQGLFNNSANNTLMSMPANVTTETEKQKYQSDIAEDYDKFVRAEATKRKKAIPLYIGLATGFCGSFTSFSSFARDMFLALSNKLPYPISHPHPGTAAPFTDATVGRNGGYGFEAFLHVVITTLALSLGGLVIGAQLAVFLESSTPRIHGNFVRKFLDPGMVVLAFGCWLGAVFLAIWPPADVWRGQVLFSLVFAPVGCFLRFFISMKLNGIIPSFPLGTFAVNMLGTAIEGMCFDIQHIRVGVMGRIGGGVVGCQVLQGVLDGFCGCLTTVSTWVAEINTLKRKHGWRYAFGSVLGGLCLMIVIMGSVRWSVGYTVPACNVGYPNKIHG
ncbi:hypothetical protein LTR37_014138 [Vermiconidia calcicola]|uniref:Uncharacterized protein n=1 Tax=Vermiconidia calcicola TaxID=1690605 RepID=A0ACC3MUA3_9PEZI|nr:hypothetical protein LTR37_014138 [Vermiconidia calcicola]